MSYIGTNKIAKMFLGSTEIAKAYLGSNLVFQKGGGGGDLPAGAIPCEFIFTDAYNGFIESGLTPGAAMSYEFDAFMIVPGSGITTPFGYIISSRRYAPIKFDNGKPNVDFDGYYQMSSSAFISLKRLKARVAINQTGVTVDYMEPDGTPYQSFTYSYNETDFTPSQSFALLGRKNSATSIETGTWRGGLGRLKCYNDDHFGNLVADFNPCYYQGNFGFWEVKRGQFKAGYDTTLIRGIGAYWGTDGFTPNTRNSAAALTNGLEGLQDWRGLITSRLFAIPSGCTSIRVNAGNVENNNQIFLYKSDGGVATWYNYNTADRVVNVPANATHVRLSMTATLRDSCYIYDTINKGYIWKGVDVQPGGFIVPTKTQVATVTSVSAQGAGCYGDYLIGFAGPNHTAWLWNLRTSSLVQSISIPVSERGFVADCHSNTVNFGSEFYDPGDDFPLIYVSTGYSDGTDTGCLVYRLVNNGGIYSLVLVQTLKFPGTEWTEFITAGNDCYVYRDENGSEVFYKFPMPTLQDGSLVTFDFTQATAVSNLGGIPAWYAGSRSQGRCFYNGKLYYASGVPNNETLLLIVANLNTGVREVEINLGEVGITVEPEAAFIWDNKICIFFWQNAAIYQIEWQ